MGAFLWKLFSDFIMEKNREMQNEMIEYRL